MNKIIESESIILFAVQRKQIEHKNNSFQRFPFINVKTSTDIYVAKDKTRNRSTVIDSALFMYLLKVNFNQLTKSKLFAKMFIFLFVRSEHYVVPLKHNIWITLRVK